MLRQFLERPEVTERCEIRGSFGLMAFHGGNLERTTDAVAAEVAERTGASLYAVLQEPPHREHLASTAFDPAESPALARFLGHNGRRNRAGVHRQMLVRLKPSGGGYVVVKAYLVCVGVQRGIVSQAHKRKNNTVLARELPAKRPNPVRQAVLAPRVDDLDESRSDLDGNLVDVE